MPPATPSAVFSHHARALQIAAPKEWEAFVECFDAYATEVTLAVTAAAQQDVLVAQGQARAFIHLLSLLRNCHRPNQATPPSA